MSRCCVEKKPNPFFILLWYGKIHNRVLAGTDGAGSRNEKIKIKNILILEIYGKRRTHFTLVLF